MGENVFRGDLGHGAALDMGDLLLHNGVANDAEVLAAKVYNADRTFFVLNGTSCSNHIVCSALLTPGDIVLYETNFGVTLPTCGNQRTLTSFLGFKKCSLDGLVTLVDAPYRVYDNTVQYRRYLRSKAKREQAV